MNQDDHDRSSNDIEAPRLPPGYSFQVEKAGRGHSKVLLFILLRKTSRVRRVFRRDKIVHTTIKMGHVPVSAAIGDVARVTRIVMKDMWSEYNERNALTLEAQSLVGEYPPRIYLKEEQ